MKVVVTGANSAVGRAILRYAASSRGASLEFIIVVRSDRAAAALNGTAARVVRVSYDDAASLRAALNGVSAVIHLAGILVEHPDSTYEEANVDTTRHVAEAATRGGVRKLIFVSAIGADEKSVNRYWRTKGEAEAVVRASSISHTVLRVPMLLGRGTEAAGALRRNVTRRRALLLGGGRTLQQPLCVNDLARAVIIACDPGIAKDRTLDLVGPVSLPEREMARRAASLLNRDLRIVSVPTLAVRLALAIVRRVAGRSFSRDALEVLTTDTTLDPAPAARALGIELTGLDDMLRQSVEP